MLKDDDPTIFRTKSVSIQFCMLDRVLDQASQFNELLLYYVGFNRYTYYLE